MDLLSILLVAIIFSLIILFTDTVKAVVGGFFRGLWNVLRWIYIAIFKREKLKEEKERRESAKLRRAKAKNIKLRKKAYKKYIENRAIYNTEFVNTDPSVVASDKKVEYLKLQEENKNR